MSTLYPPGRDRSASIPGHARRPLFDGHTRQPTCGSDSLPYLNCLTGTIHPACFWARQPTLPNPLPHYANSDALLKVNPRQRKRMPISEPKPLSFEFDGHAYLARPTPGDGHNRHNARCDLDHADDDIIQASKGFISIPRGSNYLRTRPSTGDSSMQNNTRPMASPSGTQPEQPIFSPLPRIHLGEHRGEYVTLTLDGERLKRRQKNNGHLSGLCRPFDGIEGIGADVVSLS